MNIMSDTPIADAWNEYYQKELFDKGAGAGKSHEAELAWNSAVHTCLAQMKPFFDIYRWYMWDMYPDVQEAYNVHVVPLLKELGEE